MTGFHKICILTKHTEHYHGWLYGANRIVGMEFSKKNYINHKQMMSYKLNSTKVDRPIGIS